MRASASMTGKFLNLTRGDTALLCLPIRYIAGKMMLVRASVLGLKLGLVKPGTNLLQSITKPVVFSAMVPNQVFHSIDQLAKVETLLIGGGPVSPEMEASLRSLPGRIFHTYGMTETITHVALRRLNGLDRQELFYALPGVSFSVDERECLVIEAPAIVRDKVVTNDLVALKSKSAFGWLGRYDHVINSGGIKIIPETVERKLAACISERFFVAGIPDPELGERLVLVVEHAGDCEAWRISFREKARTLLPSYHLPKAIYCLGDFMATETGKTHRIHTLDKALNAQ